MAKERPGQYVRDHYGVPAFIGTRVAYTYPENHRRRGKITGFDGQYLLIKFDGAQRGRGLRERFHPTWEIEYL